MAVIHLGKIITYLKHDSHDIIAYMSLSRQLLPEKIARNDDLSNFAHVNERARVT